MRIFAMVFGGLALVMGLGLLGWYGREKVAIGVVSYLLRNDVATLKQLAYKDTKSGSCDKEGVILGYQLRFTSEVDYVIEPVCQDINLANVIKTGHLAFGVKRLYGSGMMIKLEDGVPVVDDAWVHLTYGRTVAAVGLFDGLPKVEWQADALAIGGYSPAEAKCEEWGFSCCVDGVAVGHLAQVRTYDCPNNCYQVCDQLPTVLFFNTSPMLNPQTRRVFVPKHNPVVQFGYEILDDQGLKSVMIDFGDGKKSADLPNKKEDVIHEYRCNQNSCVYSAKIMATDLNGNSLANLSVNSIQIVIQ